MTDYFGKWFLSNPDLIQKINFSNALFLDSKFLRGDHLTSATKEFEQICKGLDTDLCWTLREFMITLLVVHRNTLREFMITLLMVDKKLPICFYKIDYFQEVFLGTSILYPKI